MPAGFWCIYRKTSLVQTFFGKVAGLESSSAILLKTLQQNSHMWNKSGGNKYYIMNQNWCYIEETQCILQQLFFVIPLCLLPCNLRANHLKNLYFWWMNLPWSLTYSWNWQIWACWSLYLFLVKIVSSEPCSTLSQTCFMCCL